MILHLNFKKHAIDGQSINNEYSWKVTILYESIDKYLM